MHWPDDGTLLDAWECGLTQPPQQKVITVMSAFMPDRSWDEISALPIGCRDAALLEIHRRMFGSTLAAVAQCPRCRLDLEAEVAVADLNLRAAANIGKVHSMTAAGYRLSFRLPTTDDLLAIGAHLAVEDARRLLLGRCVIEARDEAGTLVDPSELPDRTSKALAVRMAKLDPQATITLSVTCPACGEAFVGLVDVAVFVLRQLHAWAVRLLREIHSLASAYGWSESQIFALSPARRRMYVELVAW